ncbi:hypothetical protein A2U01_0073637, partial [Trifolium medium]|nr:hypothetical protein [Trifolium medium]
AAQTCARRRDQKTPSPQTNHFVRGAATPARGAATPARGAATPARGVVDRKNRKQNNSIARGAAQAARGADARTCRKLQFSCECLTNSRMT